MSRVTLASMVTTVRIIANLYRLPGVNPFSKFFNRLFAKRSGVVGFAAGDQALIANALMVLLVCTMLNLRRPGVRSQKLPAINFRLVAPKK